jgi:hypothetical protein
LDFILLAHWNNSPRVDMSLHSDILFWFRANLQSLLFLLNAACLVTRTHDLPHSRRARWLLHHWFGCNSEWISIPSDITAKFFFICFIDFSGGGILKRENLTNTPNGDGHKMVTMTFIWCRCFTRDIKTLIYYTDWLC